MKKGLLLFDLDGTLTDPGLGITNSVWHALDRFGIPVASREELYPFVGPPLKEMFQKTYGFSEADAEKAVSYFRDYFRDQGIFENVLYPAIPDALRTLKGRGYTLALATSKPEPFARRILDHFSLSSFFDFVGGATFDDTRVRKADVIRYVRGAMPEPYESLWMIGDRDSDIRGAQQTGLYSLGVLWGYGSREELQNAGADKIISRPEELKEVFP